MSAATLLQTSLSDLKLVRRGKVRDVYAVDEDSLLIVATDRISAFDCILPTPIERKGQVLTALSEFWFEKLKDVVANHLIESDVSRMPPPCNVTRRLSRDARCSCVVRKCFRSSVSCVVISSDRDGKITCEPAVCVVISCRKVCRSRRSCPKPLFTPSTKAEQGHDENITEDQVRELIGEEHTAQLRDTSLRLYSEAEEYARQRGIIIADTKFEFGLDKNGELLLVDEVLTPDSSRFWPADDYEPGRSQPSFDKQFVRDYLETLDWDKKPPAPPIPAEIAAATTARYLEAYRLLTGKEL